MLQIYYTHTIVSTLFLKGGIPLLVFLASPLKYINFKTIFYQVKYNFSGKPPYFPAICLKYNNCIGIPLQFMENGFKFTIFPTGADKSCSGVYP